MAGQFERRPHGNELVAFEPIGNELLFAQIGDVDVTAVRAKRDAFGQRADLGLSDLAYRLAVTLQQRRNRVVLTEERLIRNRAA